MRRPRRQDQDLHRMLIIAKIAKENAAKKKADAEAEYYRKQTESLGKTKKWYSLDSMAKVAGIAAIFVLPLCSIAMLQEWGEISQVQNDKNHLVSLNSQLETKNQKLVAEIARLQPTNVLFQSSIPENLQGKVLTYKVAVGWQFSNSGSLTVNSSSQPAIWGGQLPASQMGLPSSGGTFVATPASINSLSGNQAKSLFQTQ